MDKEYLLRGQFKMEEHKINMMDNGNLGRNVDKEQRLGLMELTMSEILKMTESMEKELFN